MSTTAPPLKRRSFLKLGIGAAVVLAVAGGAVALLKPGLVDGKLSPAARQFMARIAQAMLVGSLPTDPTAQQKSLDALLQRMDAFFAGLPDHVLAELSQLLGLLGTAAGRRGIVGLSSGWDEATVQEIDAALKSMRASGMALRQQAYLGLHDIVCAPYFSGDESWAVLGYPGPIAL
jgi:hypothetical protein